MSDDSLPAPVWRGYGRQHGTGHMVSFRGTSLDDIHQQALGQAWAVDLWAVWEERALREELRSPTRTRTTIKRNET